MSESSFNRLVALVEQIKRLSSTDGHYSGIGEARYIPSKLVGAASRIRFSYDAYRAAPDPVELEVASLMQKEFVERYRVKGEAQKRERLLEIAAELETLRIELPHIAAKACVEIGVVARECRAEAEQKHPIGDAA